MFDNLNCHSLDSMFTNLLLIQNLTYVQQCKLNVSSVFCDDLISVTLITLYKTSLQQKKNSFLDSLLQYVHHLKCEDFFPFVVQCLVIENRCQPVFKKILHYVFNCQNTIWLSIQNMQGSHKYLGAAVCSCNVLPTQMPC